MNIVVETINVVVTKVWPEGAPSTIPTLTFTLLADGAPMSPSQTRTMAPGVTTATFNNVPKYNASNQLVRYSIQESAVPGYYTIYTKKDTAGYQWQVENYNGNLLGTCVVGNWWLSDTTTAYEYNASGVKTGRQITLTGSNASPTYGFGLAQTPVVMSDGNQYLIGMNRNGYLSLYDTSTLARVGTSSTSLVPGSGAAGNAANSLAISKDGQWLFAGTENAIDGYQRVYVYNTQAVITALKNATTLPAPTGNVGLTFQGLSGDIVELPNGNLLLSAFNGTGGIGLYIAARTGAGTYAYPQRTARRMALWTHLR